MVFKPSTQGARMRSNRLNVSVVLLCSALAGVFWGCGISSKKLNAAEQQIAALQQQGVADSLLSEARVLLVQAKSANQLGKGTLAKTSYDSLESLLAKAQTTFGATTAECKPLVESIRQSVSQKKLALTGLHLREADSLIAALDATIAKNDWPVAKAMALSLDTAVSVLIKNEQLSKEIKPKLIGLWTNTTKHKEEGVNAIEKKTFLFSKDGTVSISEEMNGQTNPSLKEDWKFESKGTYDVKGDTVFINVLKEKCLKQTYQYLKGKAWVKDQKPTYDSTITNGKKDRYMAFDYLKETFQKK